MKKELLIGACAVTVLVANSTQAIEIKTPDLSSVKNVSSSVTSATSSLTPTSVKGTIATLNQKLVQADASVQASFMSLVSALSSKEEATKVKTQINAINANKKLSNAEKSAKVATIISDYGNALEQNQEKLGEQLKKASNAKKTEITNAVIALSVASYQYVDIANDCKNIAMSISANPTLAVSLSTELTSLKDTGVILKNNVKSLKDLTTEAIKVAKIGGIEIKLPKSTNSKTKKVNITSK